MTTRRIHQRLAVLEQRDRPASGGYSIIKLAEGAWRKNRAQYIDMALECAEMRYWLHYFTDEEVDWNGLQRRREQGNGLQNP